MSCLVVIFLSFSLFFFLFCFLFLSLSANGFPIVGFFSVLVQANALALRRAALSSRAVGPVEDAAMSPIILRHFVRS